MRTVSATAWRKIDLCKNVVNVLLPFVLKFVLQWSVCWQNICSFHPLQAQIYIPLLLCFQDRVSWHIFGSTVIFSVKRKIFIFVCCSCEALMELIFYTHFPQMLIQNLNHPTCVQNIQINSKKSLKTYTFQQQDIFRNHCHFGISSMAVSNQAFEISETAYTDKLNRAIEHSWALGLINIVYLHLKSLCSWTTLGSHIVFMRS